MSRSPPRRGFHRLCARYAGSAPLMPGNVPLAAMARLPSPLHAIHPLCAAYARAMSRSPPWRGLPRFCARYTRSALKRRGRISRAAAALRTPERSRPGRSLEAGGPGRACTRQSLRKRSAGAAGLPALWRFVAWQSWPAGQRAGPCLRAAHLRSASAAVRAMLAAGRVRADAAHVLKRNRARGLPGWPTQARQVRRALFCQVLSRRSPPRHRRSPRR